MEGERKEIDTVRKPATYIQEKKRNHPVKKIQETANPRERKRERQQNRTYVDLDRELVLSKWWVSEGLSAL